MLSANKNVFVRKYSAGWRWGVEMKCYMEKGLNLEGMVLEEKLKGEIKGENLWGNGEDKWFWLKSKYSVKEAFFFIYKYGGRGEWIFKKIYVAWHR